MLVYFRAYKYLLGVGRYCPMGARPVSQREVPPVDFRE